MAGRVPAGCIPGGPGGRVHPGLGLPPAGLRSGTKIAATPGGRSRVPSVATRIARASRVGVPAAAAGITSPGI